MSIVLQTWECIDFIRCADCEKIVLVDWSQTGSPVRRCSVYLQPKHWWRRGGCPISYVPEDVAAVGKQRIGQQKGKKKTRRKERG